MNKEKRGSAIMGDRELKEYLDGMEAFLREKHTKEQAKNFLVGTGIYNIDDTLTEPYKE